MDTVAINNLRIIKDLPTKIEDFNLIIEGNKLNTSDDDNFKSISSFQELEYPVYFSFYQLFNSIRLSNLYKINDYKTNDIIKLMDLAIINLCDIIEENKEAPYNQTITGLIDEIDSKWIILNDRNDTCSFWKVWEIFNDYLDKFSEALQECNRYLYISNPTIDNEVIEHVNPETGETNPNLIYDDDNYDKNNETDIDDDKLD